jgi:hypothetical protein
MTIVVADPDLWAYMSFGRLFFETGRFPLRDTFSYLPTLDLWVYHEWLTGIVFYKIHAVAGGAGIQIGKYLIGFSTFFALWRAIRRQGGHEWAAVVALGLAAIPFTLAFSPVRAQAFTNLFFAVTLFALLEASRRRKFLSLLWLAPLQAVWANLHGGFVSGIGLICLFAIGELIARRRFAPYLATAGICLAATLVNPYGLDYWTYMVRAVGMARPNIAEWGTFAAWMRSPDCDAAMAASAILMGIASLGAFFGSPRKDRCGLFLLIATGGLALLHVRHLPFFLMVGAVNLGVDVSSCPERWRAKIGAASAPSRKVLALFHVGVCFAMILLAVRIGILHPLTLRVPATPEENRFYYPVGALEFMARENLSGNIAVTFDWGSYVAWTSRDRLKISYDGRYETVYAEETTRANFDFWQGRGDWRSLLADYATDLVLLPPEKTPKVVLEHLSRDPAWREIYRDAGAVLFQRRREAPGPS